MNTVCRLLLPVLLLSLVAPAVAQAQKGATEGPVGIFDSQREYYDFMGGIKQAAYGEGGTAEMQALIPIVNDIVLEKPVGSTANQYGLGGRMGLLADEEVRKELEMVDSQYEELQEMNREIQKQAAAQLRDLDFGDASWVERLREIRQMAGDKIDNVLLPHQVERLRQLRMQNLLRQRSLVDVITSDPVKTELEVTDEQTKILREEEKKIREELEKKIAKLRMQARDRLLGKLRADQAEKVKMMIGEATGMEAQRKEMQSKKQKKKWKK